MARIRQLTLRYARARLGRFGAEDVAQDVAQEVCMAVHTALPDYDERGLPFEAFLYAIAARKVADAQRSLMRGPAPEALSRPDDEEQQERQTRRLGERPPGPTWSKGPEPLSRERLSGPRHTGPGGTTGPS